MFILLCFVVNIFYKLWRKKFNGCDCSFAAASIGSNDLSAAVHKAETAIENIDVDFYDRC